MAYELKDPNYTCTKEHMLFVGKEFLGTEKHILTIINKLPKNKLYSFDELLIATNTIYKAELKEVFINAEHYKEEWHEYLLSKTS